MHLPQPIARLMDEIFYGKTPADLARLSITTITLVLTLLAAASAGSSTPNDDGSSIDNPAPEQSHHPDYLQPGLEVQSRLNTIHDEVYSAINDMRTEQNLSNIFEYPDGQSAAQYKAETNAVTGREDFVEGNINMLQAHLPLEVPAGLTEEEQAQAVTASGYAFIEMLRTSPEHAEVFMNPTNLHMAVGTAYSAHDDQVWLVLQFE